MLRSHLDFWLGDLGGRRVRLVTGGKESKRPGREVMSQGAGGTREKRDPESTVQGSSVSWGYTLRSQHLRDQSSLL